jgi:hypothetical protein
MMRFDPYESRLKYLSNECSWASSNLRREELRPSQYGASCRSECLIRRAVPNLLTLGPNWLLSDLPPVRTCCSHPHILAVSSLIFLRIRNVSSISSYVVLLFLLSNKYGCSRSWDVHVTPYLSRSVLDSGLMKVLVPDPIAR